MSIRATNGNIMFEYIFFEARLRDKFVSHAKEHGAPCRVMDDPLGFTVSIPEDLPEEVLDDLEQFYDLLEKEQMASSREQGDLRSIAGIGFILPDGQSRMLPLKHEMANRLLASFSLDEIKDLFSEVARCTLQPSDEHLCRVLRKELQDD